LLKNIMLIYATVKH